MKKKRKCDPWCPPRGFTNKQLYESLNKLTSDPKVWKVRRPKK